MKRSDYGVILVAAIAMALAACSDSSTTDSGGSDSVTITHTITFNANGGGGTMASQTVAEGATVSLTANSYSSGGFAFKGWAKTSNATNATYSDSASYTMGSTDVTLYALWSTTWSTPTYAQLLAEGYIGTVAIGTKGTTISYGLTTTQCTTELTTYLSPYRIGQYEVTYELWYTVRTWAESNGYTFGYKGIEGNDGTAGEAPTSSARLEPVTTVNWRDSMVWCNAYTEWYNAQNGTSLTCVYCTDTSYGTPVRVSDRTTTLSTTSGTYDAPCVNASATGFRLPREIEWQYAATEAGVLSYNYVSGDRSAEYDTSTVVGNYAWYGSNASSATHTVGTRTANALGLYDMSGNVFELCFDWFSLWSTSQPYSGVTDYSREKNDGVYLSRVRRGGSWYADAMYLRVGYRMSSAPSTADKTLGFRVCQSQ